MASLLVRFMVNLLLLSLAACCTLALEIPPPKARPIIIGTSDYSNVLFGKLQRAAALWGTNLGEPTTILSPGDAQQKLNSCLWNKFAMANCGPEGTLEESDLLRPLSSWIPYADLKDTILFFDTITPKPKSVFAFLPFMKKDDPEEVPIISPDILKCSVERGAAHIYVLCLYDTIEDCKSILEEIARSVPSTIVAVERGITMDLTDGWICSRPQDMEGEFMTSMTLSKASDEGAAQLEGASIPAEDVAELMVQVSLRTDREPESYPRVVRVAPGGQSLVARTNADYFTLLGGRKARERAGTIESVASWATFLAPFGEVNTVLGKRPDKN